MQPPWGSRLKPDQSAAALKGRFVMFGPPFFSIFATSSSSCKSAASVCETAAVLLLYHGTVKQLLLPFYDLFMGAQANVGESANAELQDSGIAGSWYHGRYNIAGSW